MYCFNQLKSAMGQRHKLIKPFIDSLPLEISGKKFFYRDSITIGFSVVVTQSKIYFIETLMPNGQNKRKTIGNHGVYHPRTSTYKC